MHTKIFSEIITPRLIIRPIRAESYFAAEQASINELLPHWSWVKTDKSVNDVKKFISEAIENHKKACPSEMHFSLLSKNTHQYLGSA